MIKADFTFADWFFLLVLGFGLCYLQSFTRYGMKILKLLLDKSLPIKNFKIVILTINFMLRNFEAFFWQKHLNCKISEYTPHEFPNIQL